MKTYLKISLMRLLVVVLALAGAGRARAADELTLQLQKGLLAEEAHRDYNAALKAYQAAVAAYDTNRQAAATAVFRLGETYRKLGRTNEARVQYERVVIEFADQTNLVALSLNQIPKPTAQIPSPLSAAETRNVRTIASRPIRVVTGTPQPEPSDEEQAEIERLQAMLKNSPDLINAKVEGQQMPLHKAAWAGQTAVAEFLIKNGADINRKEGGIEMTPLLAAAQNGHKAMAELLLKHGADKDAADSRGLTPLILAASKGYRAVVEELIGAGADVNAQDSGGYAALHYAAAAGDLEMTRQLLKVKADTGVKTSNTTWMNRRDEKGATPLLLAAKTNNLAVVSALLAAGAEVNAKDANETTPLLQAFSAGNGTVLKRLLDAKADVRVRSLGGYTILHYIKKTTTTELVKQLLQAGAELDVVNSNGGTPLTSAVGAGNLEVAKLLLENGANPNVQPDRGHSPLQMAITLKNADMVRLLLEHKAKPDLLPDAPFRQVPVLMGAILPETDIMKALIDHGADLSVTNDKGYTPLHYAVAAMNVPMVELLVKHKADPNAVSNDGETPVTLAQGGEVVDLNYAGRMTATAASPGRLRTVNPALSSLGIRPTESEMKAGFEQIVKLLVEQGGDEFFKRRKTITVSRKRSGEEQVWAVRDAAKVNQFSLNEMLVAMYAYFPGNLSSRFSFPDFTRISISRLDGKNVKTMPLNLGAALENGNCEDVWLEWGDIVEIPEADHNLDERWMGLKESFRKTLAKCSVREVTLRVKGQSHQIKLAAFFNNPLAPGVVVPQSYLHSSQVVTNQSSFILSEVVFNSRALQASSDTKRVKVIRKEGNEGKTREMIYDIGTVQKTMNDLRLRDGDVIEVPEKE